MSGPVDWDDLVIGPCQDIFGEPVVYTPAGGVALEGITGVFDRAYLELFPMGGSRGAEPLMLGGGGNVTTVRPVLGVQISQFGTITPKQGDTVTVPSVGITFTVREVQPDGHGGAKLLLNKAS